ncbi:MAG: YajG family lipoprotein [Desulfamplus sp.]
MKLHLTDSILKAAVILLCCLSIIAGCTDKSQSVKLVPDIPVLESNQGKGKIVTVKVADKRPNSVIGYRASSSFSNGGEITLSQSLEKLVLYESIKGLMKKGFNPLAAKPEDFPVLTIDIQEFRYYTSTEKWTGAVHTKATLKAGVTIVSSNQTKRFYENVYTVNNEKKNVIVSTAAQNQKFINEMLNDVMQKLLDDNQLIEFMGKWIE